MGDYKPAGLQLCTIVAVRSPAEFWVVFDDESSIVSLVRKAEETLSDNIEKVENFSETDDLYIGRQVFVFSMEHEKTCIALVVDNSHSLTYLSAKLLGYPTVENVDKDNVYQYNPQLVPGMEKCEILAYGLYGAAPLREEWSEEAKEEFSKCLKGKKVFAWVCKNKLSLYVWNDKNGSYESVLSQLIAKNVATPAQNDESGTDIENNTEESKNQVTELQDLGAYGPSLNAMNGFLHETVEGKKNELHAQSSEKEKDESFEEMVKEQLGQLTSENIKPISSQVLFLCGVSVPYDRNYLMQMKSSGPCQSALSTLTLPEEIRKSRMARRRDPMQLDGARRMIREHSAPSTSLAFVIGECFQQIAKEEVTNDRVTLFCQLLSDFFSCELELTTKVFANYLLHEMPGEDCAKHEKFQQFLGLLVRCAYDEWQERERTGLLTALEEYFFGENKKMKLCNFGSIVESISPHGRRLPSAAMSGLLELAAGANVESTNSGTQTDVQMSCDIDAFSQTELPASESVEVDLESFANLKLALEDCGQATSMQYFIDQNVDDGVLKSVCVDTSSYVALKELLTGVTAGTIINVNSWFCNNNRDEECQMQRRYEAGHVKNTSSYTSPAQPNAPLLPQSQPFRRISPQQHHDKSPASQRIFTDGPTPVLGLGIPWPVETPDATNLLPAPQVFEREDVTRKSISPALPVVGVNNFQRYEEKEAAVARPERGSPFDQQETVCVRNTNENGRVQPANVRMQNASYEDEKAPIVRGRGRGRGKPAVDKDGQRPGPSKVTAADSIPSPQQPVRVASGVRQRQANVMELGRPSPGISDAGRRMMANSLSSAAASNKASNSFSPARDNNYNGQQSPSSSRTNTPRAHPPTGQLSAAPGGYESDDDYVGCDSDEEEAHLRAALRSHKKNKKKSQNVHESPPQPAAAASSETAAPQAAAAAALGIRFGQRKCLVCGDTSHTTTECPKGGIHDIRDQNNLY